MFPPKKQAMAADPEMDAVGALMAGDGGEAEAPEEEVEEAAKRDPQELLAEVEALLGELRAAVEA
jgi:hypothetical protein